MSISPPERLKAVDLIGRFLNDRGDEGLALELAARAVEVLPAVDGKRVLDVGAGPGHYAMALEARGARVAAVELDATEVSRTDPRPLGQTVGDGRRLPFASAMFDGVVCSNMLEHTPDPFDVLDDLERVTKPGGWIWVSWTNWLSPWGGHAIAPLHYLGAERGLRVYRRIFGEPSGKNLPFDGVWPLHIRDALDHVARRPGLALERVEPRYYPQLRAIMHVPGAREVLSWNCVLWLRRTGHTDADPESGPTGDAAAPAS